MNVEPINSFEKIGDAAKRVVARIGAATAWNGNKIDKPRCEPET